MSTSTFTPIWNWQAPCVVNIEIVCMLAYSVVACSGLVH